MTTCRICHTSLSTAEAATYQGRCEDCWGLSQQDQELTRIYRDAQKTAEKYVATSPTREAAK